MRDRRLESPMLQASLQWMAIGVGLCTLLAAGCTRSRMTTSYYRPIEPQPRPLPPPPPDARADALVLNVSTTPDDTNGNGYPDLIRADAHLFDTRYPPAIREDGAFVFQLYAAGDVGRGETEPVRRWRIDEEQTPQRLVRSAFGDCYQFRLSLLEEGTDSLPFDSADLVGWFEPADGRTPIYAGQISSIQVGQRVFIPRFEWQVTTDPPAGSGDDSNVRP